MRHKTGLYFRMGLRCLTALCCSLLVIGSAFLIAEKRQDTVSAYAAEESGVTDFVSRLYTVILERTPDEAGLAEWTGYLENGTFTGAEVAEGFIMSEEFLGKEMTNEEFVQILYQAFFGREADPDGLVTWVDFLNQGYRKSYVFAGFANSEEFGSLCVDYGVAAGSVPVTISEQQPNLSEEEYNVWLFVERMYTEVLDRIPDMSGIQEWVSYLQDGTFSGTEVASGFILSDEFQAKDMTNEEYVQIMYRAFFGREADPSGLATWVNALETEFTKEFVFEGFSKSAEFGTLCESYGILQFALDVPEITAIYNAVGGIMLEWNAVEGATGYAVYRKKYTGTGYWYKVATVEEPDVLIWKDVAVGEENGVGYRYTVQALAGKDLQIESGYDETGSAVVRLSSFKEDEFVNYTGTNIFCFFTESEQVDGYEVRLLHNSAEYKIFDNEDLVFWGIDALELDGLDGVITTQVRSYKSLDGVVHYSVWSPEKKVMRPEELDAAINAIVEEIKNSSDTELGRAIAIYEWIINNTEYKYGICNEDQRFENVVQNGYAVCGGYANSYEQLAKAVGLEVNYVAGWPEDGGEGHAWNQVKIDGQWYNLDTTWGDYGTMPEGEALKYISIYATFFMSDKMFNEVLGHDVYSVNRDKEYECPENYDSEQIFRYIVERESGDDCIFAATPEELKHKIMQKHEEGYESLAVYYYTEQAVTEAEMEDILASANEDMDYDAELTDMYSTGMNLVRANILLYTFSEDVTEFVVPDGITEIEDGQFENHDELIKVKMPSSITRIGNRAFYDCDSLTEIIIPSGVTYIGDGAFEGCNFLESIIIPSGVQYLGDSLFKNCNGLNSVIIFEGPDKIGDNAFYYSGLTSIDLPESITEIGNYAFNACVYLESIELPESVETIGDSAFRGSGLKQIKLPAQMTSIGAEAFSGSNLESIELPKGITEISKNLFYNCKNLKSIEIPEGVTSIGYAAFDMCSSLEEVIIPEGVTSIDLWAFAGCTSLKRIELPDSIVSIGAWAFNKCNNLTIYCPAGSYAESFAIENGIDYVTE